MRFHDDEDVGDDVMLYNSGRSNSTDVALEKHSEMSYTRPAQLQVAQCGSQRALRRQYPSIGPKKVNERKKV